MQCSQRNLCKGCLVLLVIKILLICMENKLSTNLGTNFHKETQQKEYLKLVKGSANTCKI